MDPLSKLDSPMKQTLFWVKNEPLNEVLNDNDLSDYYSYVFRGDSFKHESNENNDSKFLKQL